MNESAARRKVIQVCKILEGMRLVEGFGHVSARLEGGRALITPALGPGQATADELLIFNLDGTLYMGQEGTAPLERWMHFAVYRARPDVGAICRTHSRMAAALGAAGLAVRAAHGFGGMLGLVVPVHPETDLIATDAMGRQVAETLGEGVGVLLRGNGALVTGESLEVACVRAIYLEEAAWIQAAAAGVGGALPFTAEELARRARWYAVEAARAWAYYAARFAA